MIPPQDTTLPSCFHCCNPLTRKGPLNERTNERTNQPTKCIKLWWQGSGSTFAWQVLKEVVERMQNMSTYRLPPYHIRRDEESNAGLSRFVASSSISLVAPPPLHVLKGHYLNRMLKDSESNINHLSRQNSEQEKGSAGNAASQSHQNLSTLSPSNSERCIAGTYRDFRDVLCSHARRGGVQSIKACRLEEGCDATALEKSEAIIRVSQSVRPSIRQPASQPARNVLPLYRKRQQKCW